MYEKKMHFKAYNEAHVHSRLGDLYDKDVFGL